MRIERQKAVAVAIDFQERILPAMYGKETLLMETAKLLKGLRILGVPVYLTQQYTRGLGMTVSEITDAANHTEYIEKIRFSAACELLNVIGPPRETPFVLVAGIEAHVCVLQTLIELKEAGYQPVLVTDCVSSRKKDDCVFAIERAKQEGVLLTTCEAVLFELLVQAGSDTFKQISRLVK